MDEFGLTIREKVFGYLAGEVDLAGFYKWFSPEAWNIDQRANDDTRALVHRIDLLFAELQHGDWEESEFRKQLTDAATYSLTNMMAVEFGATFAPQATCEINLAFPVSEFVDIRFEEASWS